MARMAVVLNRAVVTKMAARFAAEHGATLAAAPRSSAGMYSGDRASGCVSSTVVLSAAAVPSSAATGPAPPQSSLMFTAGVQLVFARPCRKQAEVAEEPPLRAPLPLLLPSGAAARASFRDPRVPNRRVGRVDGRDRDRHARPARCALDRNRGQISQVATEPARRRRPRIDRSGARPARRLRAAARRGQRR